jgi:hypothetical protein
VRAANELASSPTYAADFGSLAPDMAAILYVVTKAGEWRSIWEATKAFLDYATVQRATWESDALERMDVVQKAFDFAVSRTAGLKDTYAATTRFFDGPREVAKRAAASRKAKRRKRAAGKGK